MPLINSTESIVLDTYGAGYVGSTLSIIAGLLVVYTYLTVPALRVQPNSILVAKSVFDTLLGVMIVIEYVPYVNITTESDPHNWRDCGADLYDAGGQPIFTTRSGWIATWLTQWFFTLSLLCFGVISLDLLINSTNPFANMRKNNIKYGVGVFLISLLPPTIMVTNINGTSGSGYVFFLFFCEK